MFFSVFDGCIGRFRVVGQVVLTLCLGAASAHAQEGASMQGLTVVLDGRLTVLTPGPRFDKERVLVPLRAFSEAVGAEVKALDGNGRLAVCKGDLCIPLDAVLSFDGEAFAPLATFGEGLGLKWEVDGDALRVTSENGVQIGLGIGNRPPDFTLPDLYSGEPVSLGDYRGKKTVFYMWASW